MIRGIHTAACCPRVIPWKGRKTLSEAERAILDSAPGARADLTVLAEKARDSVMGEIYEAPFRFGGASSDIAQPRRPRFRAPSNVGRAGGHVRGARSPRRQRASGRSAAKGASA